jgi:hypothetical protein
VAAVSGIIQSATVSGKGIWVDFVRGDNDKTIMAVKELVQPSHLDIMAFEFPSNLTDMEREKIIAKISSIEPAGRGIWRVLHAANIFNKTTVGKFLEAVDSQLLMGPSSVGSDSKDQT